MVIAKNCLVICGNGLGLNLRHKWKGKVLPALISGFVMNVSTLSFLCFFVKIYVSMSCEGCIASRSEHIRLNAARDFDIFSVWKI